MGPRWGRRALTKSSYARSLNADGLGKSFLGVKCRGDGGGSWLHGRRLSDLCRGLFGVRVGVFVFNLQTSKKEKKRHPCAPHIGTFREKIDIL